MRVPLGWLRELCPTDLPAEDVAQLLTDHGVEVDRVLRPWEELSGVVVASVLEVADHPNADTLTLVTVDDGAQERHVVAGVRNYAPGDAVAYAPPGATLSGGMLLEERTLRGERSEGMLCSPKELGISADHGGIAILTGSERSDPGTDLIGLLGLDDAVIDIDVFPNRPDLFSVLGVAREVAAITGSELRRPEKKVREDGRKASEAASVEVRDERGCPRYLARVITGVSAGQAPLQAQIRLTAAGMRPVSAVVDATNYVLLELGQPLHPFDLSTLAEARVVVRRAEAGETLQLLDGEDRILSDEDLLIADPAGAIALAGVMGGAATEVADGTTDVLLESAHFDSISVLRTARRHGLRTEASVRFERGADPEAVGPAAARAAGLIADWTGGVVLSGEIDVGEPPARPSVRVRASRATALLGQEVTVPDVVAVMDRLGLESTSAGDEVTVEVPGHRVDLRIEADLIEEVGRLRGYEGMPSTLPAIRTAGGLDPDLRIRRGIEDGLARAGLHEARSVSFASAADVGLFEDDRARGVRVANPISGSEDHLRSSLLPGILRAAAVSASRGRVGVRLFEVGRTFRAALADADPPVEEERVAALLRGRSVDGWPAPPDPQDYLDAKGALEALFATLGITDWDLGEPAGGPYHPGRSARVRVGEATAGEVGELHPAIVERYGLDGRVAAFELLTGPLRAAAAGAPQLREPSRFPPVRRDVAFVIDRSVTAASVRAALLGAGEGLMDRVVLFDVYEGEPLPEGKRSLAYAIDLRAPDRTLTDEEANEVVATAARRLAEDLGAELRSEDPPREGR